MAELVEQQPELCDKPEGQEDTPAKPNMEGFHYDELFPALSPVENGVPVTTSKKWSTAASKQAPKITQNTQVTQVFNIHAEERKYDHSDKFGEGESMRMCSHIMKETGANIEIYTRMDKSLTFLVSGKPSSVQNAQKKIVATFQTQLITNITVPKEHHKWILGKAGKKLIELEASSGAKIVIPNMVDPSDQISVTGTRDAIEKALHAIRVISDEQSKKAFERFSIPKVYHAFINGGFGENITNLAAKTGTRINMPPLYVENEEITITGEKDGVEQAKKEIMAIYDELDENMKDMKFTVEKFKHKYLIGPKGAFIHEVMKKTGCSLEVPPMDSNEDTLILRGPADRLSEGVGMVMEKSTSMRVENIDAPARTHRFIIGKKGCNIRKLQDEFEDCHVEFVGDLIRIEGRTADVKAMAAKLKEQVHNLITTTKLECIYVDKAHIKYIIGKSGAKINKLRTEYEVTITVLESETPHLRIEGPSGNVDAVKQELEELVKKMENEKECELKMENKFHGQLIGSKGEKIRDLQDTFHVAITIPNAKDGSDVVKIRGQKDDVDKCVAKLTKIYNEIKENSYEVAVTVYPQFVKYIIGKEGSTINRIREDTGTKIDIPKADIKCDVITITGKKANVEEAKQLILKIQKEHSNIITEELNIPYRFHNQLIGPKGKLVQSIKEECGGITIIFPPLDKRSDKVTLKGPAEDVIKAKKHLLQNAADQHKNSATLELKTKQENHKFLIGKGGAIINKIREETGARIVFPNERDADKETITIIGKESDAKKAYETLVKMIKDIEQSTEKSINVDPKHHKMLAQRRHRISEEYPGVQIFLPRALDDPIVRVKGPIEFVNLAIKDIENFVAELDDTVQEELFIDACHHRHFVVRSAEVLYSIIKECGGQDRVKISFPKSDHSGAVIIKGLTASVAKAKTLMLEIVKDLEDQVSVEVNIASKHHGFMLRYKLPPTVKDIEQENNVKISFPKGDDRRIDAENLPNGDSLVNGEVNEHDIVSIRGKSANCENAKKQLLSIVPVEMKMEVNSEYHAQLIGSKGDGVNRIMTEFDVFVKFPRRDAEGSDASMITLIGSEAHVAQARKHIEEKVHLWASLYKEEINIDHRVIARMIGHKGINIRKLMKEFNVEIRFPRDLNNDNKGFVTIIGDETNVLDCKEEMLNMEEDYLEDSRDSYRPPIPSSLNSKNDVKGGSGADAGFVVKNAPWDQKAPDTSSIRDFPSFGPPVSSDVQSKQGKPKAANQGNTSWGPRKK